jgi:hypothetical protein
LDSKQEPAVQRLGAQCDPTQAIRMTAVRIIADTQVCDESDGEKGIASIKSLSCRAQMRIPEER